MTSKGKGWNYLAMKKIPALFIGLISKHHDDFYCLNCLDFFATKNKHESDKKM